MTNKPMTDDEVRKAFADQVPGYEIIKLSDMIDVDGDRPIYARDKQTGYERTFYMRVIEF